ncbi:MAG TPA: YceI family protein [Acetobacteraceae bacterium]|nr:YceI family protein [Acetobacteraceae bacterium]
MLGATLALLILLAAAPLRAEPRSYAVQPGSATVEFRAYGLGLLPIDGAFGRFRGTLTLDPAVPGTCRVELRGETASLRMSNPDRTAEALGPDLMDAAHFPELVFQGACRGGEIVGTLSMHGVARPLSLGVTVEHERWVASGLMRRADWGMGARPLLAGPEVRLRVTVAIPAGFPARP